MFIKLMLPAQGSLRSIKSCATVVFPETGCAALGSINAVPGVNVPGVTKKCRALQGNRICVVLPGHERQRGLVTVPPVNPSAAELHGFPG